jgi:hypothetical protein
VSDASTSISISTNTTTVTASSTEAVSIDISPNTTSIEARGIAIGTTAASGIAFSPHGTVTATNLQGALEQLADQDFRSTDTPTGTTVSEGDTWYDTDDNQYKIYRETSIGVFQWVPIIVGNTSDDSDTLDAGAF